MQQIMFSDRFIQNENGGAKAKWKQICEDSNVVSFNSKTCTDYTYTRNESDFHVFVEEKKIYRKSFGQIGV